MSDSAFQSWAESLLVQCVDRLPRSLISRAFGRVSDVEFPQPIQAAVNETLATIVGIDRAESPVPPWAYPTINDVFTRPLAPGSRPVESAAPNALVAPVDGRLTRFGRLRGRTMFRVKGRPYDVDRIVADPDDAELFSGGWYAIFYLSPRDYHRIHSPACGTIRRFRHLPGHLFPVNEIWVRNIDNLFAANERIVSFMETQIGGTIGFIKVGAACVGRTSLTFHDFTTVDHDASRRDVALEDPVHFQHGEQVGTFNLGSTVVLLLEDRPFEFKQDLQEGQKIEMGRQIGRFA